MKQVRYQLYTKKDFISKLTTKCARCRGGLGGARGRGTPFRQVITQKKATFCSQTVKPNILLSQNAGNAISETLDVQNFPVGAMPPDPIPWQGSDIALGRPLRGRPPPLSKIMDPPMMWPNVLRYYIGGILDHVM